MSRGGNLDLNSVQENGEMLKKELQQTMLNQELIFRSQVYELHRLYKVQKTLMEEYRQKEFSGLNLQKGGMYSTSVPLGNPSTLNIPSEERTFPVAPTADPMWSRNPHLYEEQQQQQSPGLKPRPFDLQLPADQFINRAADDHLLKKVDHQNFVMNPSEAKNLLYSKSVSDQYEVKPLLSEKVDYSKKGRDGSNMHPFYHDVIDLEQPSGGSSNHFALSSAPCRYKNEPGATSKAYTSPSQFGKSCAAAGPSNQKQPVVGSGFDSYHGEMQSAILSNGSAKGKSTYLDLNAIQPDDCSDVWNRSMVANPSIGSSSGAFQQFVSSPSSGCSLRPTPIHAIKEPEMHPPAVYLDLNSVAVEGNESENWTVDARPSEVNDNKLVYIDLEAEPELSLEADVTVLCDQNSGPENGSFVSKSKTSGDHSSDKDEVVNAVEEQMQLENGVVQGAENGSSNNSGSNKLSSTLISDCITGQSSGTGDIKYATEGGSSNSFAGNGSQAADSLSGGDQEQRSMDTSESYNLCGPTMKPKGMDEATEKAAEMLLDFSIGAGNPSAQDEMDIEEENKPQRSIDSYESLVLNQKELGPEDYCISSNAYDINIDADSDKKGPPYKLKRGTRMRDFQKDILPVLSTLARHEICEDINIIDGVIRSREYKKMRAQMGLEVENWSKTVRGRRARVNYGRRY